MSLISRSDVEVIAEGLNVNITLVKEIIRRFLGMHIKMFSTNLKTLILKLESNIDLS